MLSVLLTLLVMAFFSIPLASPAMAAGAGGWRLQVADTEAFAKGGAFVSEADNPSAVFFNPAGLTQIKKTEVSVGGVQIQPKADATSPSGVDAKMKRGVFYIPNFYAVSKLGTEKFAVGFGLSSFWGLTTEWQGDSFMRYSATKSVIASKDYMLTGAYEVNDKLSLGLGVDIDASMVDLQKKMDLTSTGGTNGDGNFRLKGYHNGVGLRAAALYKLNEQHQFGLMYRSTTPHKYRGTVMLDNITGAMAGAGYFGGSSFQTDVVAKLTLPQSVVLGYTYKPTSKWLFNFSAEWTDWSSYEEFELAFPDNITAGARGALTTGNPKPKDWHSVMAYATGVEYSMTDRFRLRGGFYYHQNPVPAANWSPMLPDADSHAFTAGFGYDIRKDLTFDFAYGYMVYNNRTISNSVDGSVGNGKYKQWINLVLATVTYKF